MRLTIDESQISSKQKNKARILRILGEKGLLTRRNLAHEINLTPAAITNLTSDLIKENYVYEKGTLPSKKGKTGPRSINLDLTIDSVWILGVHIKFKMIEIASVNLKGEIFNFEKYPYSSDIEQEEFMNYLVDSVKSYINNSDRKHVAIGVGCFGLVNDIEGVLIKVMHFPKWKRLKIKERLEQEVNLRVKVNYHVRAMTIAEKKFNFKVKDDFLVLFIGKGIGTGMYLNGKLFPKGGELAHINLVQNGKECWCGQRGCVGQYISEPVILEELGFESIPELQSNINNAKVRDLLYSKGKQLGQVLTSFLQMIPLEYIILNGDLFIEDSPLIKGMKDFVVQSVKYYEDQDIYFEEPSSKGKVGVTGAASIVIESQIIDAIL